MPESKQYIEAQPAREMPPVPEAQSEELRERMSDLAQKQHQLFQENIASLPHRSQVREFEGAKVNVREGQLGTGLDFEVTTDPDTNASCEILTISDYETGETHKLITSTAEDESVVLYDERPVTPEEADSVEEALSHVAETVEQYRSSEANVAQSLAERPRETSTPRPPLQEQTVTSSPDTSTKDMTQAVQANLAPYLRGNKAAEQILYKLGRERGENMLELRQRLALGDINVDQNAVTALHNLRETAGKPNAEIWKHDPHADHDAKLARDALEAALRTILKQRV